MYQNEKEATSPIMYEEGFRSRSYVTFTYTPYDNVEIISTTFFQLLFKNLNNYRVLNDINLKIKATKKFSMSVRWQYLFDQFPAGTAPKTTYSINTGGQFEF